MGNGNKELDKGTVTGEAGAEAGLEAGKAGGSPDGPQGQGRKPRKAEIKAEFLGLADVADSVPEPKKKRGRKPKGKENPKDTATIETMVKAVYGIAANRLGPVWNVSDEEAKSIAVPLASILARYEKLIQVSQYSDVAMLILALGAVTVPRLMVTMQERREAKKSESPAAQSTRQPDTQTSSDLPGSIKERIPSFDAGPY